MKVGRGLRLDLRLLRGVELSEDAKNSTVKGAKSYGRGGGSVRQTSYIHVVQQAGRQAGTVGSAQLLWCLASLDDIWARAGWGMTGWVWKWNCGWHLACQMDPPPITPDISQPPKNRAHPSPHFDGVGHLLILFRIVI